MAGRIMKMRELLKEGLTKEGTTVLFIGYSHSILS